MDVYNQAHRLARGIKESDAYTDYFRLRKKVISNEKAKEMLLDFQQEQMRLQAKQYSGEELTEEDKQRFNNLREIIELNSTIKKYLDAEYRVSVLLNDLQKILFADLEIGIPPEDPEDEEKHPEE